MFFGRNIKYGLAEIKLTIDVYMDEVRILYHIPLATFKKINCLFLIMLT